MTLKSRVVKLAGLVYLATLLTVGTAAPAYAQGCWAECIWAIQMCASNCQSCEFGCGSSGGGCSGWWYCT